MQHHDGAQAGKVPPSSPVAAAVVAAAQRAVLLDNVEVAAALGASRQYSEMNLQVCAHKIRPRTSLLWSLTGALFTA